MRPLLLLAAFSFALSSSLARAQERRMIDVGGHKLDVKIKRGGSVNIIFEAGAGEDMSSWDSIFDEVGTFANAIAYSRAGHGNSEMSEAPRTTEMIYKDFAALCDALSIDDSVILVGHSRGSFLVRYYIAQNPELVDGLVLIDGYHERHGQRHWELDSIKWQEEEESMQEMMEMAKSGEFEVPEGAIAEAEENIMNRKVIRGGENMPALPDIPTAVFTSLAKPHKTKEEIQLLRDLQSEWTVSSNNVIWMVTDKSGHHIHQEQPELVSQIIKYIHDLVLEKPASGN